MSESVNHELGDQSAKLAKTRLRRIGIRVLCVLAVATCIGWGLNRSAAALDRDLRPAGFARGMVHGALMPLAMPNLLIGYDVSIYASKNTGRTYKLGYALGVNLCGLIFFGFFFWRVTRWRGAQQTTRA
jgi:hypothetical protein